MHSIFPGVTALRWVPTLSPPLLTSSTVAIYQRTNAMHQIMDPHLKLFFICGVIGVPLSSANICHTPGLATNTGGVQPVQDCRTCFQPLKVANWCCCICQPACWHLQNDRNSKTVDCTRTHTPLTIHHWWDLPIDTSTTIGIVELLTGQAAAAKSWAFFSLLFAQAHPLMIIICLVICSSIVRYKSVNLSHEIYVNCQLN